MVLAAVLACGPAVPEIRAQVLQAVPGASASDFQAERLLSSILRSAPGGIGVVVDRVIVQVNDYILQLTGYSREELMGRSARVFYPTDEDYEYVGREKYRQISETGTGTVETRWITKDGKLLDVILSSTPLDASDLGEGVVFTVTDVTEKNRTARALRSRNRDFLLGMTIFLVLQLILIAALARTSSIRRRTAEELREKTEELDRYFSSSLDLLCIADTSGRFLRLNPEWEKVLGYPIRELEGRNFLDFVHPEDLPGTHEAVSKLDAQEPILNFTNRYLCKDGSYRWIEWRSRPVGSTIYAAARDITDRLDTEDRLRLSEERFDLAMLAVNDGIWDWNVPSGAVYFDARYYTIAGYEPDEFPHKFEEFQNRVHPADLESVLAAAQAHLSGRTPVFDIEFRFLRKDGTWMWIRGRGKVVARDGDGNVLRMIGTHTDVTDKRVVEEELRKSRVTLDLVLNTIPQSVFWKDRGGRYLGCNQAFARDVGLEDPARILGKTDYDLPWTPEDAEAYRADDREVAESGRPKRHITEPLQKPDGIRLWIDTTKVPLWSEAGEVVGVLGVYEDVTERKLMEERLAESTRMLNDVIDTIPVRVFWKDRDGRYLGCNRSFAEDAGKWRPEDVIGLDDFALAWKDQAEAYRTDDLTVVEGDEAKINYEEPMTSGDGNKWLRTSKIPLKDSEGRSYGILGVYEDITERRNMEEQLRQANLVVENSPAVLFRWKAEEGWPTLLVTENVAQFGYAREEFLSGDVPFASLVHPEDLLRVAQEVRSNTDQGLDRFEQIYRIVTRDGAVRWVDDRTKVIRDKNGGAVEYQGVLFDITERKQAEAELERSLNFQSALLDAVPTAVFYKDREGRYQGCNKVFTEIMGVASEEIRGKTVQELWPSDMAETYHLKDLELMAAPVRQAYEYRVKDRNGLERPVIFTKDVFRDERGEVAGIVGAFLDITERRRAEEELKALNETLEQRIRDRTRELDRMNSSLVKANEELQTTLETLHEAQDSLVQSEKLAALGQLIAGIAHELNTPLGAIVSSNQSMLQLIGSRLQDASRALAGLSREVLDWFNPALETALAAPPLPEEPAGRYRRRKALVLRLAEGGTPPSERLVEALLDLRLDEDPSIPGLVRDHPDFEEAVDALDTLASIKTMSDVISVAADKCSNVVSALLYYVRREDGEGGSSRVDVVRELESLLTLYTNKTKYGVRIEKEYRCPGSVRGNRNQLNQVWMNLIQNALQAMDFQGTLGLTVDKAETRIVVSVRDTGPGVPEHLRKKIFEPFFTTKKSGEGTGLGLDICRKIVERHGGRIELESEPGNTVFRVFLPEWEGPEEA